MVAMGLVSMMSATAKEETARLANHFMTASIRLLGPKMKDSMDMTKYVLSYLGRL